MRAFIVALCFVSMSSGSALAQPNGRGNGAAPAATNASASGSTLARVKTIRLVAKEPLEQSADQRFQQLRTMLDRWHRFEIIDRPDRAADVTITFSERQVQEVALGTGAPVGAALANPATALVSRRVVMLTIRRPSTSEVLWHGEGGSVDNVLQQLRQDVPPDTPVVCIVLWCR